MFPRYHVLSGVIFCFILFLLFPKISLIGLAIILISTIFIDVDHYFYYVCKKRDLNLKNSYSWFVKFSLIAKKMNKQEICRFRWPVFIFHGIEFVLVLIILSFYLEFIPFVLAGVLLHLSLDILELIHERLPTSFKLSFLYVLLRNRKKEDLNL